MKSKKSNSKKFTFDLLVFKNLSIPLSLSISRDVASNVFMSNINYAERVIQTANILVGSQVNNKALHKLTILYISIKPAVIEMVEEYMLIPYIQDIDNTTADPILESMAISYKVNQPVDSNL